MSDLLSVQEAQARILKDLHPVGIESVPLALAGSRILAADVISPLDFPPFTNSSMDGFAVQSLDLAHASPEAPVSLDVIEDIPAGHAPEHIIKSGQAARIMTGSMLPGGADCVIPVELTDARSRQPGLPARVACFKEIQPGENTRPAGKDFRQGQKLITSGTRLLPHHLGLLATIGMAEVSVYRKPRIALLSSGNELLPVGDNLAPAKLHDSNSHFLADLIHDAGAEIIPLGIATDTDADVAARLQQAMAQKADLILTSAGVSVGEYDKVRSTVEQNGNINFWRVNIRPGKPLAFGQYQSIPLIGLPGNPVSSYVTFLVFALPAIRQLSGSETLFNDILSAALQTPVESDGRESYLRATVRVSPEGELRVELSKSHQGSGNLLSLMDSNALLIVPSGVKSLPIGTRVKILLIGDLTNE